MSISAKMVFSAESYIALAGAVAAIFWIIFNVLDGLLFFSPMLDFYNPIPSEAIPGFVLSNIAAPLIGVVTSMNIYILRNSSAGGIVGSLFSGPILSTASSICVGCSSIGVFLATAFGSTGAAASSFMANYQLPFRLLALGLLAGAYYSEHNRITKSCTIKL